MYIYKGDGFKMKENKRKALMALMAVWLLAFAGLMNTWSRKQEKGTDIVTAFASGNYIDTNGTVSVYANYGNKYLSEEDKKQLIEKLAVAVGIQGEIDIYTERREKEDKTGATVITSYTSTTRNAATDIRIVTVESRKPDSSITLEQYILADISINNSLESTVYYDEKLQNAFEDMDISADVTLSLKGCVEGSMSNSEKNRICEDIIEKLDGKLVIGSRSDELYSVYAYTEKISDYVLNGTTKSNINIAITYDSDKDVTWIYMATPIIGESY